MLQENIKVAINIFKSGEPVEDLCLVWESLNRKELARVERALTNTLSKLNDLAELDIPAVTGDNVRSKVEFDFTMWNDEGEEAAWSAFRYSNMNNGEMEFLIGLLRGEIDKLVDKTLERKSKKTKPAKSAGGVSGGTPPKK